MKTLILYIAGTLLVVAVFFFGYDQHVLNVSAAQDSGNRPIPPAARQRPQPAAPALTNLANATIVTNTTAISLALAMDITETDIVSASFMGSDPLAFGMGTAPLGRFFPSRGDTYAILSTGLASSAVLSNTEENLSYELDELNNSQENDMAQLWLRLKVPEGVNCAVVGSFAFYSEEFPEFVDSEFNDTFTAELGETNLIITGTVTETQVLAPNNFAFDPLGNVIDINTVFGVISDTQSTYDGVTPLLQARTPVTPTSNVDLFFTVQDLGDSIYDSAVFLDNFAWSTGDCVTGATLPNTIYMPMIQKEE